MINQNWDVNRVAGALGAEIRGLDLAKATDDEITAVNALLSEHMVLFFPDQHPTVEEHVALGKRFGKLDGHPHLKNPFTQHPELFELAMTLKGSRQDGLPGRIRKAYLRPADMIGNWRFILNLNQQLLNNKKGNSNDSRYGNGTAARGCGRGLAGAEIRR